MTINNINGKRYIGQRTIPEQYKNKIQSDPYLGSGTLLLKAIEKYGKHNFNKLILALCKTNIEADNLECFYFKKYKVLSNKNLYYNRALPGQYRRHKDHRKYMSDLMSEFYTNPENKIKLEKAVDISRIKRGLPTLSESRIIKDIHKNNIFQKKENDRNKKELRNKIKNEINMLHAIKTYNDIRSTRKRYLSERHLYLHNKFRTNKRKESAKSWANKDSFKLNNSKAQYKIKHHINDYCIDNNIVKRSLPKSVRDKIDRIIGCKYSTKTKEIAAHEEIMSYLFKIKDK